jgi:hypothetical protein
VIAPHCHPRFLSAPSFSVSLTRTSVPLKRSCESDGGRRGDSSTHRGYSSTHTLESSPRIVECSHARLLPVGAPTERSASECADCVPCGLHHLGDIHFHQLVHRRDCQQFAGTSVPSLRLPAVCPSVTHVSCAALVVFDGMRAGVTENRESL